MPPLDRAVCFDCDQVIERRDEIVFAPPHEDIVGEGAPTACFHPLCLMRWRERRQEMRARMSQVAQAFMAHITGQCGCGEE